MSLTPHCQHSNLATQQSNEYITSACTAAHAHFKEHISSYAGAQASTSASMRCSEAKGGRFQRKDIPWSSFAEFNIDCSLILDDQKR